jgi:hypothetical protein
MSAGDWKDMFLAACEGMTPIEAAHQAGLSAVISRLEGLGVRGDDNRPAPERPRPGWLSRRRT